MPPRKQPLKSQTNLKNVMNTSFSSASLDTSRSIITRHQKKEAYQTLITDKMHYGRSSARNKSQSKQLKESLNNQKNTKKRKRSEFEREGQSEKDKKASQHKYSAHQREEEAQISKRQQKSRGAALERDKQQLNGHQQEQKVSVSKNHSKSHKKFKKNDSKEDHQQEMIQLYQIKPAKNLTKTRAAQNLGLKQVNASFNHQPQEIEEKQIIQQQSIIDDKPPTKRRGRPPSKKNVSVLEEEDKKEEIKINNNRNQLLNGERNQSVKKKEQEPSMNHQIIQKPLIMQEKVQEAAINDPSVLNLMESLNKLNTKHIPQRNILDPEYSISPSSDIPVRIVFQSEAQRLRTFHKSTADDSFTQLEDDQQSSSTSSSYVTAVQEFLNENQDIVKQHEMMKKRKKKISKQMIESEGFLHLYRLFEPHKKKADALKKELKSKREQQHIVGKLRM